MVIQRVEELIDGRHLLTHSFYRKWADGTLPKENLQEYGRQYYAFESNFPRFISAIHSRTEQPEVRQALLENLWDEEHGAANHAELWLRFAEAIGIGRDDVRFAPAAANNHVRFSVWIAELHLLGPAAGAKLATRFWSSWSP